MVIMCGEAKDTASGYQIEEHAPQNLPFHIVRDNLEAGGTDVKSETILRAGPFGFKRPDLDARLCSILVICPRAPAEIRSLAFACEVNSAEVLPA